MPLHQYQWSLRMIFRDLKSRRVEKPRATLPVEFTTTNLRYIRQLACQKTKPSDCGVWTDGIRYVEFGDNPCQRCKQPGISSFEFSAALFGHGNNETDANLKKLDKDVLLRKNKRVVRRYLNSDSPMHPDDFKRAVANATLLYKWISLSQGRSILMNTLELESSYSWLRRFMKRLRGRVSFRNTGIISDEPATIANELDAELKATYKVFGETAKKRIACARHINAEDKQWLLHQVSVTENTKSR